MCVDVMVLFEHTDANAQGLLDPWLASTYIDIIEFCHLGLTFGGSGFVTINVMSLLGSVALSVIDKIPTQMSVITLHLVELMYFSFMSTCMLSSLIRSHDHTLPA